MEIKRVYTGNDSYPVICMCPDPDCTCKDMQLVYHHLREARDKALAAKKSLATYQGRLRTEQNWWNKQLERIDQDMLRFEPKLPENHAQE